VFTPEIMVQASGIRFPVTAYRSRRASMSSTLECNPSTGISFRRFSGSAQVREITRRNGCFSAVKRRIAGAIPTVEKVMAFPEMAPPQGSERMRAARIAAS
jgi:hypothetical protein